MTDRGAVRIVVFTAIAFGWAWGWWLVSIFLLHGDAASPVAVLTSALGTCAPAVAAWVLWWHASESREAWRRVGRCLLPSGSWLAWVIPAAAIIGVISVAAWVQQRFGGEVPAAPVLWLVVPQLVIQVCVGGGQEEIGWRGWLQPALRERTGRWRAPLIVGAIWFCWHLPLWWMPGSIQTYMPMPAFAMMTFGMSLLLARAVETTNGRPAVAIWLHALNNLAATWLVFVTPELGAAQPGSWAMGVLYLIVGAAAMLIHPARSSKRTP